MIGMLVSVLVDRYQRVYARKLYKNEEEIDFDDYSDDENNDTDSKVGGVTGSGQLRRRINGKEIEDPDARARINATFVADDPDIATISDPHLVPEHPLTRPNSRVQFIIGYVNDENHQTSDDLLETIGTVIAHKQTENEKIQLSLISDNQIEQISPENVRFRLSMSSSDDDDEEEFTEIGRGRMDKGSVLKKFQCPPSPDTQTHRNQPEKRV
jgi:hypothetical protein